MTVFFTPGPTQLHEAAKQGIREALETDVCSISHRSADFQEIYARAESGVRKILHVPVSHHIFFLSSATEAMERIIQNCVETESFHFVNGAFSERFRKTSEELRRRVRVKTVSWGEGFDLCLEEVPESSELIAVTQNETSTGVHVPLDDIYALKKKYPDKLLALDLVSAVPYVQPDFSQVDLAFFSGQKGFGLPAGLGVIIVGPQAMKKSLELEARGLSTGSYHSFTSMQKSAEKHYTVETPNVLGLYLLGKVSQALCSKTIVQIQKETIEKAWMLYDYFTKSDQFELFVTEAQKRSPTIVVAKTQNGSRQLIEELRENGISIGAGYKHMKEDYIRVANFPMHTKDNVTKLLDVLDQVKD